jgi:hypothetical protein
MNEKLSKKIEENNELIENLKEFYPMLGDKNPTPKNIHEAVALDSMGMLSIENGVLQAVLDDKLENLWGSSVVWDSERNQINTKLAFEAGLSIDELYNQIKEEKNV